jgi:2-haloacid dehalogenase
MIKAVLFDAFGTLFDVHSVALRAEQLLPGQGLALSHAWRDKQIELSRLVSMSDGGAHYLPFWELTQAALHHAAQRLALPLTAATETALMNEYRHLSAYPEVGPVLGTLQRRGLPAGILSNGDPQMLEIAVKSAGFAPLLSPVLSAHRVRRYKTDPAVYALGPQALGLPAAQILFVSSNGWDALGATWFGYRTLWVNRGGAPPEPIGPKPHHTGPTLRAVLSLLDTDPIPSSPAEALP